MGNLRKLKFLFLSGNRLEYLPACLINLRLIELNICKNMFKQKIDEETSLNKLTTPTLFEVSARSLINNR